MLLAPRVLVDGTVYKMWYTYARLGDIGDALNLCNVQKNQIQIGYATSQDGLYWVRSPSNPVVPVGAPGSTRTRAALLLGCVVPDAAAGRAGVTLYYSTLPIVSPKLACVPNGVGRASRP